jgi:hypothetical protein
MKINGTEYGGQHNTGLTFTLDAGAVVGDALAQTAAGTAGRGADANPLLGKLVTSETDSKGTVLTRGVIVVPWSGAAVYGRQTVSVDGAGKAKVNAAGRACQVLGVDSALGIAAIDLG